MSTDSSFSLYRSSNSHNSKYLSWNEDSKFFPLEPKPVNHSKHTTSGKHIKLEVLGKRGIYTLLVLNYICFIVAISMDITESEYRLKEFHNSSNGTRLSERYHYNDTWVGFNSFNRFLLFALHVKTDLIENITDMTEQEREFYELQPWSNNLDSFSSPDTIITLNSITSGRNSDHERWTILEEENLNTTCSTEKASCSALPALYFSPMVKYSQYNLNLTVVYVSSQRILRSLSWDLDLLVHSQKYSEAEGVLLSTGLVVTGILLIYYLVQVVFLHSWNASLPEQKWMVGLLITLFFYQNPMFVPGLLFNTKAGDVTSIFLQDIAFAAFLAVWLLFSDGLSKSDHRYSWGFYSRKVMFGIWYFILSGFLTIAPFYNVEISQGTITQVKSQIAWVYLSAFVLLVISAIFWGFWLLWRVFTTGKVLRGMPFLQTRYRQLTFRFMIFLSLLAIIYLMVSFIIKRAASTNEYSRETQALLSRELQFLSLGRVLVLTVYCYTLVFIYLPPDASFGFKCINPKYLAAQKTIKTCVTEADFNERRRHTKKKIFCLETASILYEFADKIYYDPEDYPETGSSFGKLELTGIKKLGYTLHQFISNPVTDSHCMIFVSRTQKKIIASFRGTASFKNLSTDLNSVTVTYETAEHANNADDSLVDQMMTTKVHKGFLTAFQSIGKDVLDSIEKLVAEDPKLKIYVTGHSLGGALATICAYEIAVTLFPSQHKEVICYTFGQPRVGNHRFAELMDREVPNYFRIVNDRDIITAVPKRWLGFFVFKHAGAQILIDRRGNLIDDLSYVEGLFRGGNSSLADHGMINYQASLRACFERLNRLLDQKGRKILEEPVAFEMLVPLPLESPPADQENVQVEETNLLLEDE